MAGYIIGLVLGIIVFLLQNFKPTSNGFRILFLALTIAFFVVIEKAHLGYWNLLVIPIGIMVLCFVAAFIFPYHGPSAKNEYDSLNGRNYYDEIRDGDRIGRLKVPGFKQTYDRIMEGLLWDLVSSQSDLQRLMRSLYSKNFYPISEHTKNEIIQHITSSLNSVLPPSVITALGKDQFKRIFNTYVAVMSIHEDATRAIEEYNTNKDT